MLITLEIQLKCIKNRHDAPQKIVSKMQSKTASHTDRPLQNVGGGSPVLIEGTDLPLWGMEIDPEKEKENFKAYTAGMTCATAACARCARCCATCRVCGMGAWARACMLAHVGQGGFDPGLLAPS
jgi:hypothetical protein